MTICDSCHATGKVTDCYDTVSFISMGRDGESSMKTKETLHLCVNYEKTFSKMVSALRFAIRRQGVETVLNAIYNAKLEEKKG